MNKQHSTLAQKIILLFMTTEEVIRKYSLFCYSFFINSFLITCHSELCCSFQRNLSRECSSRNNIRKKPHVSVSYDEVQARYSLFMQMIIIIHISTILISGGVFLSSRYLKLTILFFCFSHMGMI
jgi:hypothetical protein